MPMLVNRIRTILIALVVAAVTFAAVADTNVVVAMTERCLPVASASMVAVAGDMAFDRVVRAELKAAASDAKEEYEKRYEELKTAHDRFMNRVSILVTILAIAAGFIGIGTPILEQKSKKEVEKAKLRIDNLEKIATQFTMRRAKDSLAMMRFVWAEFLDQMQGCNGKVNGREIVHPLYRVAEVLWQACEIGDAQFLNESVNAIVKVIAAYRRVAPTGSAADNLFKTNVKKNRILTDSSNYYNLVHAMNGKTPSLRTVLEFLNEFGITMFGVVS